MTTHAIQPLHHRVEASHTVSLPALPNGRASDVARPSATLQMLRLRMIGKPSFNAAAVPVATLRTGMKGIV